MHATEKSDSPIVPGKPTNKADPPVAESVAEPVEGRGGAKGNGHQQSRGRAQSRVTLSPALERVREAARRDRKLRFTSLLHHVNADLLRQSYYALKRKAAPGVDGMTWQDYGQDLENNLEDLHGRVHRGAYRALPGRRTYIPKTDGRQRALAIAALEDKIVQRAVVTVLNQIYEVDFLGFSYGFRPGRGQHDALDALATGFLLRKVNWILDADIAGFFDSLSQERLLDFLKLRIGDRRLLRLIGKWLKAGILEEGLLTVPEQGTPQGSVISPLLSNVYLHYVLDRWAQEWRERHARDKMIIVRLTPMTSSSDSSTGRTPSALRRTWRCAWSSMLCRCTRTRPGSSSSAATLPSDAPSGALASRRPSTSWASRTSARRARRESSSCAGKRDASL